MRVAAIICEYNPLHNGHQYHISATRKLTNCDCLLCVMSGNFVQRGEASVLDKYKRARHAIMAGADLVVELPPIFALSSAKFFAEGAIKMLAQIQGVEYLSFGSESGDIYKLQNAVEISSSEEYNLAFRKHIDLGLSYPKACEAAYIETSGTNTPLIYPNNVLGVEYIKAINKFAKHVTPLTIKREGANYHDLKVECGNFSSATAIRADVLNGELNKSDMPEFVYNDLLNVQKIDTNSIFGIVSDKLFYITASQLKNLYEGEEGLSNRLKNSLKTATDYNSLLSITHTKRYTKSKVARLICHTLLNHNIQMLESQIPLVPLAVKKSNSDLLGLLPKYDACNIIAENIEYCDHIYSTISNSPKLKKHIEFV